jgi:membrane fusion protein, adhesin transport system
LSTSFSKTTRSLAADSSRYVLIALVIAGLVLLAWLLWFGLGRVTVYEVSKQARLEVGSAPRDVTPVQAGRLSKSRLVIGQPVSAGDVLVELDAQAQLLRLAEASARLRTYPVRAQSLRREIDALQRSMSDGQRSAVAASESARARLREAEVGVDFALENERRARSDSLSGGSSQVDALRAATDARKAASARDALVADASKLMLDARTRDGQNEAQIESLSRTLLGVENEANATRQAIAQLRLEIENRFVRAPVDGTIGEVLPLRPGAYVAPGQKLATILPRGDLLIVAEFEPSTALGRIKPGQTARLKLDGFPWVQFGSVDAKVMRVAGEIRDRSLRVEFAAARNAARGMALRHGLTGTIEVSIETVSPAILLLRSAGQSVR